MKRISLIVVACLLLVAVCSFVACTGMQGQQQEQYYYYYMNLAIQHEQAYIAETQQAEYYFGLAQGLKDSGLNIGQQTYDELINVGNVHEENAAKYRETAENYRRLANQYR